MTPCFLLSFSYVTTALLRSRIIHVSARPFQCHLSLNSVRANILVSLRRSPVHKNIPLFLSQTSLFSMWAFPETSPSRHGAGDSLIYVSGNLEPEGSRRHYPSSMIHTRCQSNPFEGGALGFKVLNLKILKINVNLLAFQTCDLKKTLVSWIWCPLHQHIRQSSVQLFPSLSMSMFLIITTISVPENHQNFRRVCEGKIEIS